MGPSPPSSSTASCQPLGDAVEGSAVHQLESIMIEETSKEQGIRRMLWKCEFCAQTYHNQNTFDQVFHTRGHQKDS